jgi:spermine oxidase
VSPAPPHAALCNARLFGSYLGLPGGDVVIPGGYQSVFAPLHAAVEDRIRYGKEVSRIEHGPDLVRNLVRCRDGAELAADHVVVTVSLGYLKRHHRDMFDPPLSEEKAAAVEAIGFGRAGKVFLEYEEPFWAEGEEVAKIALGKEALETARMPDEWFKSVLGFEEV